MSAVAAPAAGPTDADVRRAAYAMCGAVGKPCSCERGGKIECPTTLSYARFAVAHGFRPPLTEADLWMNRAYLAAALIYPDLSREEFDGWNAHTKTVWVDMTKAARSAP